jgi:hypothetical protein
MHSRENQTNQSKVDNKWWIKWWTRETLYGSFMLAPLDELGFFVKLCCLSKQGNYEGYIKATETDPITHLGIAGMMGMAGDIENFERLLQVHKDKGRIVEDEKGIITITKFFYFQNVKGKPKATREKLSEIIERKKSNKQSTANAIQSTTRALNEVNGAIGDLKKKIRYIPSSNNPDELVDTQTGETVKIVREK